jgi:branched-chain amino acid transport system substrate-binding protein
MWKRLVVLAFVLAIVSFACKKTAPEEIRVGAYLSLSGPDSTFGTDTREGIELAVDEINAAGGVKGKRLVVLYEDTESRTQEASQKVRQLVDRDKVVALLGESASSRSLAGGLIANTSHIPMITPSSTSIEVTKDREWVFRTCFTDDQQGAAAARFVRTELKKSRVAIFFTAQDTYSSGLAKSFREAFKALGGEIIAEKGYPKGETNFRTYLAELRAKEPEAIFVPNYYNEMVLIARHAKELGIPGTTFVGGDGWDSTNLLEGAGAELEGAYFTNHYAPDVPWPDAKKFLDAFRAKYKHPPAGGSAQGYDAARVLADAMRRAPDATPEAIRKALGETKDFPGATGITTMNADRNVKKPIVVVRIEGKQFRYASEVMMP